MRIQQRNRIRARSSLAKKHLKTIEQTFSRVISLMKKEPIGEATLATYFKPLHEPVNFMLGIPRSDNARSESPVCVSELLKLITEAMQEVAKGITFLGMDFTHQAQSAFANEIQYLLIYKFDSFFNVIQEHLSVTTKREIPRVLQALKNLLDAFIVVYDANKNNAEDIGGVRCPSEHINQVIAQRLVMCVYCEVKITAIIMSLDWLLEKNETKSIEYYNSGLQLIIEFLAFANSKQWKLKDEEVEILKESEALMRALAKDRIQPRNQFKPLVALKKKFGIQTKGFGATSEIKLQAFNHTERHSNDSDSYRHDLVDIPREIYQGCQAYISSNGKELLFGNSLDDMLKTLKKYISNLENYLNQNSNCFVGGVSLNDRLSQFKSINCQMTEIFQKNESERQALIDTIIENEKIEEAKNYRPIRQSNKKPLARSKELKEIFSQQAPDVQSHESTDSAEMTALKEIGIKIFRYATQPKAAKDNWADILLKDIEGFIAACQKKAITPEINPYLFAYAYQLKAECCYRKLATDKQGVTMKTLNKQQSILKKSLADSTKICNDALLKVSSAQKLIFNDIRASNDCLLALATELHQKKTAGLEHERSVPVPRANKTEKTIVKISSLNLNPNDLPDEKKQTRQSPSMPVYNAIPVVEGSSDIAPEAELPAFEACFINKVSFHSELQKTNPAPSPQQADIVVANTLFLPLEARLLMYALYCATGHEPWLVGGLVKKMVRNPRVNPIEFMLNGSDADMIIADSPALTSFFKRLDCEPNFTVIKHQYVEGLYKITQLLPNRKRLDFDVKVLKGKAPVTHNQVLAMLVQDSSQRDTRDNTLYINRHAYFFDPTGMGVEDALSYQLVPVNGNKQFLQDSARVFRVLISHFKDGSKIPQDLLYAIRDYAITLKSRITHRGDNDEALGELEPASKISCHVRRLFNTAFLKQSSRSEIEANIKSIIETLQSLKLYTCLEEHDLIPKKIKIHYAHLLPKCDDTLTAAINVSQRFFSGSPPAQDVRSEAGGAAVNSPRR